MSRPSPATAAFAAAFALAACAGTGGRYDADPEVVFGSHRSYAIVYPPPPGEEVPVPTGDVAQSQLNQRRVRAEIDRVLAARGLEQTTEAEADLLVAFDVTSRRYEHLDTYPHGGVGYWPHDYWMVHWDHVRSDIRSEGLLIIDLIDAKSRRLVWRGWHTERLGTSDDIAARIPHLVDEVLANFPPPRPPAPEG